MNQQQMDDIMKRLEKLDKIDGLADSLKIVEASIKGVEKSIVTLEKKFDENLNKLKSDIDKKIVSVKQLSQQNSIAIKNVCSDLNEELNGIKKSTEILVASFPGDLNVPLNDLYQKMASTIGFRSGDDETEAPLAPTAKLIKIQNGQKNTSTILVRFATISDKNQFMSNYFKHVKLFNLKNMGFPTNDQRLYVSHNLTPAKYQIFKSAIKLKKADKLNAVRVSDYGGIKVRKAAGEKFLLIKSLQDLNKMIPPGTSNGGSSSERQDENS